MKRFIINMANNPRLLLLGVVGSWLFAAVWFLLAEDSNLLDSLYWSMTTMSTVGYGDISPSSWNGKVITILFQAWSIFVLVPCAITNIVEAIRIDKQAFTHDEQEWQQDALKQMADKLGVTLPEPPSDY